MSFRNFRGLEYAPSSNSSIPGVTQLPTTILDAFIPGYSFISMYVLDVFGFDISIVVSVLVMGFAFTTGFHYLYQQLWDGFLTHFTTSVVIDAHDSLFDNVMSWAAEQDDLRKVRSLRVQSADYTDDVDDLEVEIYREEGAIFNFNNWAAQVAPRYEPDRGYHWFRHGGHWFKLLREKHRAQTGYLNMAVQDQETVQLTVLGRSTRPIKDLILDTRVRNLSKQTARTTVRRPSPKEQRGRGRQAWRKVAERPSRPMGTVVLDDQQKASVLKDVNDFLNPATCRWYSSRGIPYRRGYLLSGPPGTGKTSLCFALAGVFGLDIYCMSLSEKTLSEEDLILLFNSLPKRCIVLLEDIDIAGVVKQEDPSLSRAIVEREVADPPVNADKQSGTETADRNHTESTASLIAIEVAKAVRKATAPAERSRGDGTDSDKITGITLSGLLNAIDGVASQEGRVLIMTTNQPEKLDDALIRPGRVDMKVEFTLASKSQIRELFVRMYSVDPREAARLPTNLRDLAPEVAPLDDWQESRDTKHSERSDNPPPSPSTKSARPVHLAARLSPLTPPESPSTTTEPQTSRSFRPLSPRISSKPSDHETLPSLSPRFQTVSEVEELAAAFAQCLPEATFSPAEIQGFLLKHRNDPQGAIAEVTAWVKQEMAKKPGKSKD